MQSYEGPCQEWTGAKTKRGYGVVKRNGKLSYTHILAYEAEFGPVPDGLELDHLCVNVSCMNPNHLEPVTHAENTRRHYARQTHCRHGHEFTFENTHVTAKGHRRCRECNKLRLRAKAAGTMPATSSTT